MSSETTALLRSIRRWLLATVFLLGVGLATLSHVGYVQNVTRLLYWQSLVLSAAGVLGGGVAAVAGLKLLGSFGRTTPDGQPTE